MTLADIPVLTKAELMGRLDDLVTDPRLRIDDLLQHLDEIEDEGTDLVAVEVETVDALERSPAGKLQMVVAGPRR